MIKFHASKVFLLPIARYQVRSFHSNAMVLYSELKEDQTTQTKTTQDISPKKETAIPWYLQMVERKPSELISSKQPIQYPAGSPASLNKLSEFLRDKMGLTDILVFDIRQSNNPLSTLCEFVVLASAKSAKHCEQSYNELRQLIKKDYNRMASVEGKVSVNEERKMEKRLRRKSNLGKMTGKLTYKRNMGDAWFMVDCNIDNIFINILTEQKRKYMNLEELYAPDEEKDKYQNQTDQLDGKNVEEEDNILIGLRRLAQQRRKFSTSTATEEFNKLQASIKNNDIENAISLAKDVSFNQMSALTFLNVITSQLETSTEVQHIEKWEELFNLCWPLTTTADSKAFWDIRLKFYHLLNCVDHNLYHARRILNSYFKFKAISGAPLDENDLHTLLRIMLVNMKNGPTTSFNNLTSTNQVLIDTLKLYRDDTVTKSIMKNDEISNMLLQLLIDKNKHYSGNFWQYISFLTENPNPSKISSILSAIADSKNWYKYLQFWQKYVLDKDLGKESIVWEQFLSNIIQSGNKRVMEKIILDGGLLWLKRNQVKITNNLRKEIHKLFDNIDPHRKMFKRLENYLLN